MLPTMVLSGERKLSLLTRYTQRMGALVDRRVSQVALEGARKEAEKAAGNAIAASRAKTEFLANMSHELHTPLSTIIGFAEMMEREVIGPIAPSYKEYAKNILDSGRHLLALVGDVLDMSQIENGQYILSETDIDVGATLDGIIRLVQGRAAQAGLYLQTRVPQDLPRLKADEKAFKQIVANLLSNALKFTNPGGRIFLLPEETPDGELSLRIVDTGIGINDGEIARVMLPFERVGDALTRKRAGAGLGLSLVNALVGMHGGTMKLQSKVGVGTIVTITFPRWRLIRADAAVAPDADNNLADVAGGELPVATPPSPTPEE